MKMRTSKVVGIRKSRLMNNVVPQWKPASGHEDFYRPVGSIELRINRFTEFASDEGLEVGQWSALTFIRGLPWQICGYPSKIDETDSQSEQTPRKYLAMFMLSQYESTDTAWNCQVKFIFRVVSQKQGVDDYVTPAHEPMIYNEDCNKWEHSSFIAIDKLLDPEEDYIKDDTVLLQVDVTAMIILGQDDEDRNKVFDEAFGPFHHRQLFSSSTEYPWDFVLIVKGKRVHVQKNTLSLHSEYFMEEFAKCKSIRKAILKNIDYDEFIELLSVIYPISYPVTAQNVETISKLAYIFKVRGILRQCETVLMKNISRFGGFRTFLMSHWYSMEHLQAKCIEELKTIGDPKKLKDEPEFKLLNFRAKAILLDKIVESNSVVSSATNNMEFSGTASEARASVILDKLNSTALVDPDGVLIVENKKIPIHKSHLAMYSEYFKAMFLGEFKEKSEDEIVLEEIGHADILELLAVIYPCGYSVTDNNLESVLKLADRFIMPVVLQRCKDVLKSSQKIKRALKLWLAQRYNFPDLQMEYAKEYKNVEDVKKLKAEPEYVSLNDETRSLIFDSITS